MRSCNKNAAAAAVVCLLLFFFYPFSSCKLTISLNVLINNQTHSQAYFYGGKWLFLSKGLNHKTLNFISHWGWVQLSMGVGDHSYSNHIQFHFYFLFSQNNFLLPPERSSDHLKWRLDLNIGGDCKGLLWLQHILTGWDPSLQTLIGFFFQPEIAIKVYSSDQGCPNFYHVGQNCRAKTPRGPRK